MAFLDAEQFSCGFQFLLPVAGGNIDRNAALLQSVHEFRNAGERVSGGGDQIFHGRKPAVYNRPGVHRKDFALFFCFLQAGTGSILQVRKRHGIFFLQN